ncbi:hypothetical protein LTR37_011069 [Vermiconidia calcicola]|uniref:Uncharacterized protein n=1 Tax=Vermiconidia calcicola TaxID=1690605 RepID=A0ACC3N316_9PEZI|nr:hypothetical protein LTR37_011069 [Vermiconidia calcicola]
MDQLPRNNDGFSNNNLFGDSHQQYNAPYDNLFQTGNDQNSYDASWGVNASNYSAPSRAQHPSVPNWPQNANHLSTSANVSGQPAPPYSRSLSHSPAPYGGSSFNHFGAQQGFQYRQPQYDQTLVSPHAFNQNFNNYPSSNYPVAQSGTIAPHALQHETRSPAFGRSPYDGQDYPMTNAQPSRSAVAETVDQRVLAASIPNGSNVGYFSIINFDNLAQATKSERMGNFLNIGTESRNWDCNRAALPTYAPRKSRNELRKLAGNDPKLLAKLGKKIVKREKLVSTVPRPLQTASAAGSPPRAENIKYEGDSSSEEDSSSDEDDESSYTSDDTAEPSPLPSKRPETPKEATEYDTIKALWRAKRKRPDSQSIRKGLVDFWEIVKTIRDRWKADATAVSEAESKNRANELPLLRSRVKDQRDMMESAFKAALKYGHRDIVELFSENNSLVFLCYQFLLERVKAEDYNSPLPRTMLETLALTTTLTEDKLEKTHLSKLLPRFTKKGDAKTQFYAKRIVTNAAKATSKSKATDAATKKPLPKENSTASPTTKRTEPEPVAGVKRAASTVGDGGAQKKVAIAATKPNGLPNPARPNGVVRKPNAAIDNSKPASSTAPTTGKPKQVVAKPSGLFSSLQSAAKKPGTSNANKAAQSTTTLPTSRPAEKTSTSANTSTAPKSTFSFAQTMANLSKPKEEKSATKVEKKEPLETPEEKTKRLRRESRRHLRVSFKNKEELEQVHLFHHDPEEELGHDANQMRDVGDVGGEGRMFKQQHQMMDIDDEEEEEQKLTNFATPSKIDFVAVDSEERNRNYAPYGGGQLEPESAERAVREQYEANNLMVFYADVNDIPPNPREPSNPYNGVEVGTVKKFGVPEDKYAARVRQKKASYSQQHHGFGMATVPKITTPGFDLFQISSFMGNQQYPQSHPPQQQAPQPPTDAVSNILAALKQAAPNQATPPPSAMGPFGNQYQAAAPNMGGMTAQQPAQPNGQPDLAAILAQITQNQGGASQAPAMGSYGFNAQGTAPNMMGYQPQAPQPTGFENPERTQWREGGANFMPREKRQNPAHNPYFKTKVCKYWQEGRCQKGDGCTYKHEED